MESLAPLLFLAIGAYVLYWTVRYAVRHAIADADERRARTSQDSFER